MFIVMCIYMGRALAFGVSMRGLKNMVTEINIPNLYSANYISVANLQSSTQRPCVSQALGSSVHSPEAVA